MSGPLCWRNSRISEVSARLCRGLLVSWCLQSVAGFRDNLYKSYSLMNSPLKRFARWGLVASLLFSQKEFRARA